MSASEPGVGTPRPPVSVGVPTHRRPELVRRAVEAILAQDYEGDIEVVVVHDAEPADATLERDDPHRSVRAVRNDHTRGLAGVRNCALDHMTGTIVGWCDDDDVWHPDKLRVQVEALLAAPDALGVGGGLRWVTDDGRSALQLPPKPVATKLDVMRAGNRARGLHSSTAVMRRVAYDRVGPYDETLPQSRCEDFEFFLRLTSVAPVPTVQQTLVEVRWDPAGAFSPERWRTLAEAQQLILARHPEFDEDAVSRSRVWRRIAFNYSQARLHGPARRAALASLRADPREIRSLAVLVCALVHVSVLVPLDATRKARRVLRPRAVPVRGAVTS